LIEIPDSNNVILAPATDKKSDVKIVTTGRDTYEMKYCFANTAEDMIKWLAGPAETAEDGAFVNTAGHYKNAGYIYVPDKSVNNMVEVSSKNLYMMFYYNNNKKTIDIIPMSTEDIELCGNEGSIQYLMNRKNITLNKEENIYSYTDGLKTDKVIGISTWVKDSIIVDGKNTDCLKLISKYNGVGESHIKVFVYNGHVINMEYRNVLDDTNDYDASFLDSVSFFKIAV